MSVFKGVKVALQKKYEALLKEAHRLSTTDRKASDAKIEEANSIAEQLMKLDKAK